ncbi:hypothetical protein ACAX43_26265, partial [Paraburkholderia sp. IW21]|uniref:hypothetical protein n=1 Tax=Paraburkholderia sp. IW21 TaxID=3242488 RepID=UPI00351F9F0C
SREAPTASGHSAVSSIEAYSTPANTRRNTVTFLWPMAGIESPLTLMADWVRSPTAAFRPALSAKPEFVH